VPSQFTPRLPTHRPPFRALTTIESVILYRLQTPCLSGIHYRGTQIRRVSCYTLLGWYQLPWPQSRCLYLCTLFGGSVSKVKAVLIVCSVDPALPDLLTRRGPLGHPFILLSVQDRVLAQATRLLGVWMQSKGRFAPTYFIQSLYLTILIVLQGSQLSCGIFRKEPATR